MTRTGWFLLLTLVTMTSTFDPEQEDLVSDEEQRARNYLAYIDKEFSRRATDSVNASWAYASNITDENLAKKLEVSADNARYQKQQWTETIKFRWQSFRDDDLRRQFKKYSVLGTAALSEKKHEKVRWMMIMIITVTVTSPFGEIGKRDAIHLQQGQDLRLQDAQQV
uniref:(California timema) hypothetical protein n=1 Tax=Timema californicum TaxID=61474 RepID=A0A7R9P2W0_TIMCA|nr:unnamed protein product [Timema californicum]